MDIEETLTQRGTRYGFFNDVATTSQALKECLKSGRNADKLEPFMQESLDMLCNKLARIVNGDPFYDDSWHDVAGYATLVAQQLKEADIVPLPRY
jgi:hypothetical protein